MSYFFLRNSHFSSIFRSENIFTLAKNILNTGKYIAYFKDINNFLEIPSGFQAKFRLTATRGEGLWGLDEKGEGIQEEKRGGKRQTILILK